MNIFCKKLLVVFVCVFLLTNISTGFAKEATNQPQTDEELIKLADELMATVEKLRGLKFKSEVKKKVSTQEEVRAALLEEFNEPESLEKISGEEKMLIKMGLVPSDFNYKQFLVDLYLDQLAGYYVPEEDTMYIAKWMSPDMQAPIFAHELTHALQDQHFDLENIMDSDFNRSDNNIAITSVVEGEATLIMMDYLLKDYGVSIYDMPNFSLVKFKDFMPPTSGSEVMDNAPHILLETLEFPYLYGTDFIMNYVRTNGWKMIPSLYSNLPQSTEQIMHPEKYILDKPVKIELHNLENTLGMGWEKVNTDVLGEFFLNTMIGEFTTSDTGYLAAKGWGGDQVQVFEKNKNILMVFMSSWDSNKDAKEFFNAYTQVVEKKYNNEYLIDEKDNSYKIWTVKNRSVYLGLKEDKVFVIEGADEDLLYTILKTYWN